MRRSDARTVSHTVVEVREHTVSLAYRPAEAAESVSITVAPLSALLAGLAFSTLVSEDLATIGAGLLAREGYIPLTHAVVACIVGVYVGDLGLWGLGRVLGSHALRLPWLSRALPSTNGSAVRDQIEKRFGTAILVSRFVPGSRLPTGTWRWASGGGGAAGVCRLVARCRCRVDTSARDRHRVLRRRSRHARGNRNPGWSAGVVGNGGHRARHDEASRSRSGSIDACATTSALPTRSRRRSDCLRLAHSSAESQRERA